jgi:hypothetical protein
MSLLFQSTIIAAAPPSPVRPAPNNATTICGPDAFALSIRSAELPNLFLKPAEHGELTPATGAFQPIGAWPLSPATLRKEGPSFNLPIALAMLQLKEQNRILGLDHFYLCGELALSGELRPVRELGHRAESTQAASNTIVHRCSDKGN